MNTIYLYSEHLSQILRAEAQGRELDAWLETAVEVGGGDWRTGWERVHEVRVPWTEFLACWV